MAKNKPDSKNSSAHSALPTKMPFLFSPQLLDYLRQYVMKLNEIFKN